MDDMLDIAVIGAGLAGIGGAARLKRAFPGKRLRIFERRTRIGGTWDLFCYPGIRSDSDMYTLGYRAKPWTSDKAIAEGWQIRAYIEQMAEENGLVDLIRFSMKLIRADWSSETRGWTLHFSDGSVVKARLLYAATGYYDYDEGHWPSWPDEGRFSGPIIHPQHWPESMDVAGKRVTIVGSGATAITLAPALAERGAKVTLLQRSPSYIVALPSKSRLARLAYRLLPKRAAYRLVRHVERIISALFFRFARAYPGLTRRFLMRGAARALGSRQMVEAHFSPRYDPWKQRLCVAPDGDLFKAVKSGAVAMVTGRIKRFEEKGIRLEEHDALIESDVIVAATGLNIALFGKAELCVDGETVKPAERMLYKGLMLAGVPNLVFVFGYTNASWTLKADLVADYAVRLIEAMDARGADVARPAMPEPEVKRRAMTDFSSGYFRRSARIMPRQGDRGPWTLPMSYAADRRRLTREPVEDGVLMLE